VERLMKLQSFKYLAGVSPGHLFVNSNAPTNYLSFQKWGIIIMGIPDG